MAVFENLVVTNKRNTFFTINTFQADTYWHIVGDSGEPGYQNGWTAYNVRYFPGARFRKDAKGYVFLQGLVVVAATPTSVIFTLPPGYRPMTTGISDFSSYFTGLSSGSVCRISITSYGLVSGVNTSISWVSLNGINFFAEA